MICTRKTSGVARWVLLLLLLACSLVDFISSQATAMESAIDASGEIENLVIDSKVVVNNDKSRKTKTQLDLANAQIDWLISKGGSVDREKVEIRSIFDSDEAEGVATEFQNLGIFAADDIEKGDVLMTIPASVVLTSKSTEDACDAALTLLRQVNKKGNESDFAPYLNYIYSSEEAQIPPIPSRWSSVGKNLLKTIQGPSLMPQDLTEVSFFEECVDEEDVLLTNVEDDKKLPFENAYAIALSRSWDEKLVPFLDMFNHHQIYNIATKTTTGDDGKSQVIVVSAKHYIPKGEELYTNYIKRSRESSHTVSTLLREFGFVEDYPQRWKLPTPERRSNIEENKIPGDIQFNVLKMGDENSDEFRIHWLLPEMPIAHPVAADHLKKELARIKEIKTSVLETAETLASDFERETILSYYRSLVIAYETVIKSVEEAIEFSPGPIENAGDEFMACSDFDALYDSDSGWESFDIAYSSHQEIEYYYNEETRDACLFLEEYLHACVSNRPHYHEVFVHYPAYFLDKVERVLFIGGGDSMVLHEVLKYDDQLKLVVGLELDQQVVRSTFSRIGTQPHFDNDKVEWWFGDAAKALNVLPTEYYGSFDLVVVDILSEVAEALEVTKDVTIMEAAMMLMKPTGIIVKNEDEGYVPGSTNSTTFTDYTLDVMYYDVPLYCLQTFVIGSNAVDFAKAKPKDHKLSNFYLKGPDEFQGQFDTWYTTGKEINEEEDGQTKKEEEKKAGSQEEPNTSALTVIIEAEEISVPMPASSIQEIIHNAVETVGFTVKKSLNKALVDGYNLISVLEEGIITSRCFPEKKYCAMDVQLWKSAHKSESMKKEIISGLKSKENSVFRVITTGVYGVEEKDHNNLIGPPSMKTATVPESTSPQDDSCGESESASGIHTSFTKRENPEILDFKNATMEDYDSVSALEQWYSQEPVGVHTIVEYEIPFLIKYDTMTEMVGDATYDALEEILEEFQDTSKDQIMVEDLAIGKGLVIVVTWSEGSIVGVWDGEKRFSLNIFSLERSSRPCQSAMAKAFRNYMKMSAADVFPRGTGRVMVTRREFMGRGGERFYPFWAPQTDNEDIKK